MPELTNNYTTDTLKHHLIVVVDGSDNFDEMMERIAVYIMSDWKLNNSVKQIKGSVK